MHCLISCPEMINCRCLLYISCVKDNRRIRDDIEQYSTQNSLWQLPPTCYFRWWSINSRQAGQDLGIMGITGSLYCLPSHLRHPTKAARSPSSVVCACMPPVCLSVCLCALCSGNSICPSLRDEICTRLVVELRRYSAGHSAQWRSTSTQYKGRSGLVRVNIIFTQ